MKKKFLSIFLAPLFVVPITLSSCSSSEPDKTDQQTFIYKSQDYQLEIHPLIPSDIGPCTMADISVVFTKRNDTINYKDQIYIGSLTINDIYTNPNNGYTYKTNIVTFANDKNQVLMADGSDANVEYVIDNFSVSANVFNPFLSLNATDKADRDDNFIYDDSGSLGAHSSPENTVNDDQYPPNFSIRNPYFDVEILSSYNANSKRFSNSTNELDGFITFSNRLSAIDNYGGFDITSNTNIELPNSLKVISYEAFSSLQTGYFAISQSVFTIPQSVETIGYHAFYEINAWRTNQTKTIIKCPSKFQNDAERIFGNKDDQYSWEDNTWDNYDIQFY